VLEKSQKNQFSKLFSSTSSVGQNGPKEKISLEGFCVCVIL
jgi:hypothetical protein